MTEWSGWLREHQALLGWLAAASALMFVASLILIPVVIARIPPDYFLRPRRPLSTWADRHYVLRALALVVKNALGMLLLVMGVAMLVLPGQGLLCLVAGMLLLDFPGKFRLEQWLVGQRPILRSINWVRRKARKEPLVVHR